MTQPTIKQEQRVRKSSIGLAMGAKHIVTQNKVRIMARTGMLPLDFLTAVYRDELYEDYTQLTTEDGRATYFTPKEGAKKITVTMSQRIVAANSAAPYVHKKMPIGIEMSNKNNAVVTAAALAKLGTDELELFLDILDRMNLDAFTDLGEAPKLIGAGDAQNDA